VPEVPALSAAGLTDATAAAFAPGGPLARTLPGFEPREGQRQIALAVADVVGDGGVLVAEAGTGTGKTFAYLIPAILSGRRVLVSTGTKNLQEQIFFKDLPVLRQALGLPVTATCMKGRANYLCLHRFDEHRARGVFRSPDDRVYFPLIEAWASSTKTGDRSEIEELPDDLPLWHGLAATTEHCLGSECPRYADCFITRMRQRAAESQLVIVNHHLLCADAAVRHHSFGEVVPECDVAIIDEAHQLEDVATQYFGVSVSNFRLEDLVQDARRAVVGSVEASLAVEETDLAGRVLFDELAAKRPGTVQAAGNVAARTLFDERLRLTPAALAPVKDAFDSAIGTLVRLAAVTGERPGASEELRGIGRRAADLAISLRFLQQASDPAFVFFLELRGRGIYLRAAPIDVSAIVRELLIDRARATVLTSATLAVDGSFEYVRTRLGLVRANEIRQPSEFDFTRQALLYLPQRMPEPRASDFAMRAGREVVEILRRTEGRAFVLFTSYATLHAVESALREHLPYPLLVQGAAPRNRLVELFRSTPNAVLLGTSSFWQGVDVVGDALSCVIIDKLPFASPGDPITAARIEALNDAGGDAFGNYQVPLAVLTLLQGLGRLIRHRTDRGVFAILDPRLVTMSYGRRFLDALPPAPVTRQLDDITRFLAARDGL
jgi:ATP-dependent DNA helicase DinG